MFYRVVSIIFIVFFAKCNCKSTGYYTEAGRLRLRQEGSGVGSGYAEGKGDFDVDAEVEKTDFKTWLKDQADIEDGSGREDDQDVSSGGPTTVDDEDVSSDALASGSKCKGMVDITFALDASDSIGPVGFRMIKSYTKTILGKLDLSECDNVAIIKFTDFANSETYLGTRDTQSHIFARIDDLEEPEKLVVTEVNESRIALALLVADELIFTTQLGSRSLSKKYLVLMTDGKQPRHDYSNRTLAVESLVKKLTKKGIQILVLAIGETPSIEELVRLTAEESFIFPERRLNDLMDVLVPKSRHPNDLGEMVTELNVMYEQEADDQNNLNFAS